MTTAKNAFASEVWLPAIAITVVNMGLFWALFAEIARR